LNRFLSLSSSRPSTFPEILSSFRLPWLSHRVEKGLTLVLESFNTLSCKTFLFIRGHTPSTQQFLEVRPPLTLCDLYARVRAHVRDHIKSRRPTPSPTLHRCRSTDPSPSLSTRPFRLRRPLLFFYFQPPVYFDAESSLFDVAPFSRYIARIFWPCRNLGLCLELLRSQFLKRAP